MTTTTILTAADRCDHCGARAYVRVQLGFGELQFCGHHAKRHLPALRDQAVSIIDETDSIPSDDDAR